MQLNELDYLSAVFKRNLKVATLNLINAFRVILLLQKRNLAECLKHLELNLSAMDLVQFEF